MVELPLGILLPALLAGLIVLATHVPLGQRVLARGIVFIDLAIAQVAGLGIIAADSIGWEPEGWRAQAAAGAAAIVAAGLLTWTEGRWPKVQEALIGLVFVTAASLELLLLAGNPHGAEHLKDLLVGQILWVSIDSLWPVALLSLAVLALWFGLGARLGRLGFYLLFALTVTASVQLVGVYLVFASLIVPALAARPYPRHWQLAVGYGVGVTGYALGLILSALADLPTGAVVVCTLAAAFVAAAALAPRPRTTEAASPSPDIQP